MRCGSRHGAVTLWILVLLAAAGSVRAATAEPFGVRSTNGQWRAHVEPAAGVHAARVRVSRTTTHQQAWSVPLTNLTAPATAYVTDDGSRVVTLDTVGSAGYGDDAVAIYGPSGPLQRYSLEQVLGLSSEGAFEHPDVRLTATERTWRSGAEVLLQDPEQPAIFGVWLPATHVWIAWDLATGDRLADDPELIARLNDALRVRAIAQLAVPARWEPWQTPRYWPLETLAYQRRPRDRPHLERALASPDFGGGELTVYRDRRQHRWHLGESPLRREADRLLAEWDRKPLAFDEHDEPIGCRLGAVRGEVRLPRVPRNEGVIHVLLVPAGDVLQDGTPLPAQRVDVDLAWERPDGKGLPFRLGTVAPGSYRLLALWGRRPPNADFALYEAAYGEWLSIGPIVEVQAGAVTEAAAFGAGRSTTDAR